MLPTLTSLDLLSVDLLDENSTIEFGNQLGSILKPGLVIWLDGDLGAGKTTLVRAMLRKLGFTGPVKSPTYALVEVYVVSSLYLYHFDFYRFNEPEEFVDAGLGEYFQNETICLVEWPQKAIGYVPQPDLLLSFHFISEKNSNASEPGRKLDIHAYTEAGQQCLKQIRKIN